MASRHPHPGFRPDLEGLRGLAILLVVLFHAEVPGLAGGFVGVDAFFVLSGFLITGQLAREFFQNERLDLPGFYQRRALRLLPSLLVVLVVTLGLVTWLYAPIDRAPIAESGRAVALGWGNVAFAGRSVDYFSSGENPLLHTWSLAVEEQFYLVWPVLFVLVALWVGRRRAAGTPASDDRIAKLLLAALAITGALSLAASIWLTQTAQPWAFFGMPTRLWEFALGGALALTIERPANDAGAAARMATAGAATQIAGLVALGVATALYDRATPYPSFAALLPALGAAALVTGGRMAPESVVSRALSMAPLQWIGQLSYAWYLWHWPLVGLGAVLDPGIGVAGRLAWTVAALGPAWLTHRYLETAGREGWLARMPANRVMTAILAASVAVAVASHGLMMVAERRAARPDQQRYAAAREDRGGHECWASGAAAPAGPCAFGDTRSATTVVLFGDSHAEHWLAAVDRLGRERGWKVVLMVKGGCPVAALPEPKRSRRPGHDRDCAQLREASMQRIVALRPAAAILSSWDHYVPIDGRGSAWQVTPETWGGGLRSTYARLAAAGIPTVAIRGTPRTWFDVPSCLSRQAARLPFAGDCTYDRDRSLSRVANEAQDRAVRGLPVPIVDMNDQICATRRCPVVKNGTIVFTDDNHLTASFTRSLAPAFGKRLDAALGRIGARLP